MARREAAWPIVATREIMARLTDRNFLISTGFTLVLIVGIFAVQAFVAARSSAPQIAVTGAEGAEATQIVQAAGEGGLPGSQAPEPVDVPDAAAARAALADGSVDAWLHRDGGAWVLTGQDEPGPLLAAQAVNRIAGAVFAMLFYIASVMFGMAIASSVVEEKQSRIVEILAAAIPVRDLLIGKVLGNTLLALGQMALIVVTLLVGLTFVDLDVSLPGLGLAIAWYLPFFLLGFLALACVWAAAGALASRTEDLQATTLPLTMVLVAFLLLGINLEGVWRTVASFVPIMSTILMPVRVLEGGVPWWEPALALVLVALFSYLTVHLGSRLYRRALLHTSGSLSWRRAMTLED